MADETALTFDKDGIGFEQLGQSNGGRYWFARDLMRMLGYESYSTFKNAINRAAQVCMTLDIPVMENFIEIEREVDGDPRADYKLTRFACYLTAMNGDVKKPQVAAAQAYFIGMAEILRQSVQKAEQVDRVLVRDEISDREKSLHATAFRAGAREYQFFQNQGYLGMYNMDYSRLKIMKGVQGTRSLLDFMGKRELAANLFRLAETEAKIQNQSIEGQKLLEKAAFDVGKQVRNTMIQNGGTRPEDLAIASDIKDVRKSLKKTQREFGKLDKVKRRKSLKASPGQPSLLDPETE
jgi:DNA-damage-inducible protein D